MLKYWIKASRLRTLPLACAGIICGSLLAGWENFNPEIFAWLILTAILLQILSNFANDLGDHEKGADRKRTGEERMTTSGKITPRAMKMAVALFALLSFASGLMLLQSALENKTSLWFFLALGILAIAAAITYTMGKKAYGYTGFGDPAVFIFFGIVSVSGSHYLYTGGFDALVLLPAAAIGLLCTAVLNLNNMRDHEQDKLSGKNTVVVKMGFEWARFYHTFLLSIPFVLCFAYVALRFHNPWQLLFLLSAVILVKLSKTVKNCKNPADLDAELKKQALATLLFSILFGIGNF